MQRHKLYDVIIQTLSCVTENVWLRWSLKYFIVGNPRLISSTSRRNQSWVSDDASTFFSLSTTGAKPVFGPICVIQCMVSCSLDPKWAYSPMCFQPCTIMMFHGLSIVYWSSSKAKLDNTKMIMYICICSIHIYVIICTMTNKHRGDLIYKTPIIDLLYAETDPYFWLTPILITVICIELLFTIWDFFSKYVAKKVSLDFSAQVD